MAVAVANCRLRWPIADCDGQLPIAYCLLPPPCQVPTSDRKALATPYGLLMNEVLFSPKATVGPLIRLFEKGVTLAVGNYASSFVPVFLCVIGNTA